MALVLLSAGALLLLACLASGPNNEMKEQIGGPRASQSAVLKDDSVADREGISAPSADRKRENAAEEIASRKTPITRVAKKTRDAVVAIKVKQIGRKQCIGGAGFIIHKDGYILTNAHIVRSIEQLSVILSDSTESAATIEFADEDTDVAVIKIKSERELKALKLVGAQDLMPGETVITIGHPLGLMFSLSVGVVAGLDREVESQQGRSFKDRIQIDASINTGNSGGPLMNINGDVVGMIVSVAEDAKGIAFAVPSETIKKVLSEKLGNKLAIAN